jgi:hypothetical protein
MDIRGTEAVQRLSGSSCNCAKSTSGTIGPITPGTKQTGKRSAGKPHAAFDVAGAGNVTMVPGLRSIAKAMGVPPAPTVRAPAPDPTCERLGVRLPGATLPTGTPAYPSQHAPAVAEQSVVARSSRCPLNGRFLFSPTCIAKKFQFAPLDSLGQWVHYLS